MAVFAALASLGAAALAGPSASSAYAATLWSQLDAGSAAAVGAPSSRHSVSVVTYAEDVPCAPSGAASDVVRRPPLRRMRRRPIVHKAVVHPPIVRRVVLHKVVSKARRRRPHLVHAAPVGAPKRCVVLHSERLNRADLPYAAEPLASGALDVPADYAPPGGGPQTGLGGGGDEGGGGAAFSNPVTGGGGGGGVTPIPTKPLPISATPEPETWMLTILGVGLCGGALRRAQRNAEAEAARIGARRRPRAGRRSAT